MSDASPDLSSPRSTEAPTATPGPSSAGALSPRAIEAFNRTRGELSETLGIELVSATPDRIVATMPVAGNRQPIGLLHGGASAALAETLGSYGAAINAGKDRIAVGIDLNMTHHRAVTDGTVTGVATKLFAGRSIATFEIAITDENGARVASGRLTCMLRDTPPSGRRAPVADNSRERH